MTYQEVPDHLGETVGKSEQVDGKLACLDVILVVCLVRLMIVNHLDDVEKIILGELGKTVGHLLEVADSLLLLQVISLAGLRRGLRVILVGDRAGLAENGEQGLGRVLEGDRLDVLVAGGLEVQIVIDGTFTTLLGSEHVDGHLELTPTFVGASEGRLDEGYAHAHAIGQLYFTTWKLLHTQLANTYSGESCPRKKGGDCR